MMLKLVFRSGIVIAAAGAAASAAAPAAAQYPGGQSPYEVLYERYYFDDPAMTVQVGYERDTCTYYGRSGGQTVGRYGPYVEEHEVGACENGQPAILQ